MWISNSALVRIAREAGAPKDKGAGVVLKVKLGDEVSTAESLFEIYAERDWKMEAAISLAGDLKPIGLSRRIEDRMLIDRLPSLAYARASRSGAQSCFNRLFLPTVSVDIQPNDHRVD